MATTKRKRISKKQRRIYARRRFFGLILVLAVIFGISYGCAKLYEKYIIIGGGENTQETVSEEQKYNIKTLETPTYVYRQFITNENARYRIPIEHVNDIVIHNTGNPGTTAQNNRDYFNEPATEVCSHFVIGMDGEIIQCLPLNEKSSASNNRNFDTISIEVCHADESGEFTKAAYDSLVKLTAWLCKDCSLSSEHIIRHYDITGKECPKYYVENEKAWKQLKADVKEKMKTTEID